MVFILIYDATLSIWFQQWIWAKLISKSIEPKEYRNNFFKTLYSNYEYSSDKPIDKFLWSWSESEWSQNPHFHKNNAKTHTISSWKEF